MVNKLKNELKDYILITIGITLYSLAILVLLVPHKIIGGGATGLATVVYYLTDGLIPIGVGYAILNSVLLLLAIKLLGPKFGIKTIYAMGLLTLLLSVLQPIFSEPLLDDKFMSTIIAGIIAGIGISFAFTSGGSTGGTDIVIMIVRKYRNVSAGVLILYIDSGIILSSLAIGVGVEEITYAFVLMGIMAYTVDFMLVGKKQSAQLFIFTSEYEIVADKISMEIKRGVTVLEGKGWYSKESKKILFVVVPKRDATAVLRIAKSVDSRAFMTMNTVMGVYGEGFEGLQEIK